MSFMNGGFRWTVMIMLALGTWGAGTAVTLMLQDHRDHRIALESTQRSDSLMTVLADSVLSNQAEMMAALDILRERGYRLYGDVTALEKQKALKQHAQGRSERDERRRWP